MLRLLLSCLFLGVAVYGAEGDMVVLDGKLVPKAVLTALVTDTVMVDGVLVERVNGGAAAVPVVKETGKPACVM